MCIRDRHELVHDDVSGHSESFTTGFKNVSRALGSLNIRALTELRDKYADPNDSTRIRPDFDRAFQIYRESRRRAEVTPDLFGGEESRAEVGRPGGEEDRGRKMCIRDSSCTAFRASTGRTYARTDASRCKGRSNSTQANSCYPGSKTCGG